MANKIEIDATTGEQVILDLTLEEITELDFIRQQEEARLAAVEAREVSRTSALAKLAALGLTEEEIAAL